MEIYVRNLTGAVSRVQVEGSDSISDIKRLVSDKTGIPVDQLRLVFAGRLLEDHRTIASYNMQDGSNVHVILKLRNNDRVPISNTYIDAIPIADTANPIGLQFAITRYAIVNDNDKRKLLSQCKSYQELYLRNWFEHIRMYPRQPPITSARQLKYQEILRKIEHRFVSTSDEPPKGWKKDARNALPKVLAKCGYSEADILLLKDTKIFDIVDAFKYIQQQRSALITPCSDLISLLLYQTDVMTGAVMPYFSLLDRMHFSLTCKTFNETTRQPFIWRYLCLLHDRGRVCDKHLINILNQYGTYIQALSIQKCMRLTAESIMMIGEKCPNLRILNAADSPFCDQIEQEAIFTKATKLQVVNLSITTDYPLPKPIGQINQLTELKELNIFGRRQPSDSTIANASLKVLDVRDCHTSKGAVKIDCPQLERLIVNDTHTHPKHTTERQARRYVSRGAGDPQSFVAITLDTSGSDEYYVQ